jgi:hypothetical protein
MVMDERIARLHAHMRNVDRYQNLLKTKLTEVELQFLEKRLSEERFAIATLHLTSPSGDLPRALE